MQDLLGQIGFADPSSFSPAMRAEVMLGAEGDEDRTPPGETSAERLDRLDSRRACLMAQRDPRTQELARLVAEDRQRQLGTFTPASVDVGPAAHTDTPAEVRDTTQQEAASAEVSCTGVDVQQGTHESGLAPTEEPRSEPVQPPAVQLRPKETLQEVTGVPLPVGSVEGAVHMSSGLEDIQTGQSVGVDDIRPSTQAEGIAPTNGGDGIVAGAVGVGGSGVPSAADPMSATGGGDPAQVDRRDADGQEMLQTLVVRTAVGPVVPHQAPFFEGYRRPAQSGGPVEERRVGRGACIPPVPTSAPSRTRPEIRHVATPRGSFSFGFMTAEELEDHGRRDLTEIDQRILSRRACLMAQRDPRTQELARLVAEDRQRQLGTYTPASVDVGPAAHTDTPAEVHDRTQQEAASAEVSCTGADVQQGTHESGLAPTKERRSEPVQPPAVQLRPEETLQEVAGVPLPVGSVEGAVHMSSGLEDIQTGHSVGVDDIRPSTQAEGIAPTTAGDGIVAGAVGVGGSGVPSTADPMSATGGGDPA
ncbi:hypothetical protein CBR_g12344 [Chara braunii]|uniref:Uncharacterized protein n=1 Tax=Chara braunii TaxID=69332 RepID=A0A388KRV6_CHABU|nr:hypothetical protein CBR_g12344 [Chara braunii]|eukprot:GBG72776.1 hypothetical protein CBR_g12344 [Chara braunii]